MTWILISERFPPLGTIIFLWDAAVLPISKSAPWIGIRTPSDEDWALVEEPYWSTKKSRWEWNRIELDELTPTHWHPFPDPPPATQSAC